MKIELSINTKAVQERMAQYVGDLDRNINDAVFATAQRGINIILDRTQSGLGVLGSFLPYVPKYAEFRRKNGRGSKVDLNYTGQMLGAMMAKRGNGYAEIGFTNALANKKAYYNNKRRYFFGFNVAEKKRLAEFMRRRLFK